MNHTIDRGKLAVALESIRKDISWLHKDTAGAMASQTFLLFFLIWLGVANLVNEFLDMAISLVISAAIVLVLRLLYSIRVVRSAFRDLKEGLPEFDTKIDLS